jgi:hypothetical protein
MALTQISTQGIKDGTITGSDLATNVDLVDDQKLRLGNSNDLQIYHDGSNSYIQDTDQGNLFIEASAVLIRKNGTTENIAKFIQDGAVELYYDNSKKFETAADRVNIYGHVFAIGGNYYLSNGFQDAYARFRNTGGSNDANFEFFVRDSGTETEALEITKDAHIRIPNDNKKLKIGAGDDLQLYHDGYNSYITNAGGELKLGSNHFEIRNGAQNSTRLASTSAGAVELFYDNSKKFETTSDGVSIPTDSTFLRIGAGQDLDLHHNGTNSYIRNKTGDLHIRPLVAEEGIILKPNGAVELYHDNSKKFETTSAGINITGSITADDLRTDNSQTFYLTTANDFRFRNTGGTERMRIDSSGVVSIGTTSPNGSASKLQVEDSGENNVYFVGNTSTLGARLILQNKNSTANAFSKVEGADAGGQGVASIKFVNVNDGNNEGEITLETRPSGGLPTERMRIDSSGRLIVGATSGAGKFIVQDSSLPKIQANFNGTAHLESGVGGSGGGFAITTGHFLTFNHQPYANRGTDTNLTERMRISSAGHVLVNCTSLPSNTTQGAGFERKSSQTTLFISAGATSSATNLAEFFNTNGQVGRIVVTGSATSYHTSSDYRLKENATAISDGITRLKTLKPYRFNFKADADTTVDGFFAHEVTAVPEAISGTKDEVDSDNNPVYQGIDQSKLVPLLVAALQELVSKVEVLENEVAALKAA